MLATIALALTLIATGQSQDPGVGVVRGVVRSESNHAPLKYAIVQVVGGQLTQRAVTDSSGVYVLRNVTAGIHAIRAEHLDHSPFIIEVLVPARAEVRVDLALSLRPVPLPAVLAHNRLPRGGDTIAAAAPDLGAAAVRALEASPGVAELGLGGSHVGAPGSDPADPSDVLYVRGAAADLKLVLLDGAPVYAPFHVGGLINAFDPGVLRSATLYLGGAPARYDGGLSYVMDMETRGGRRDQVRTDGSLDLLSARALIEGPFTKSAGYMVTGRTVHGIGTSLLDNSFPYGYADGLARVDYDAGAHGSVRATGFWNKESVQLDHSKALSSTARWGNTAASLRYKGELAGVDAEFTAGYGGFDATLPIGGANPVLANGLAQRVRLAADLGHGIGPIQMHYGASYDHIALHYTSRPRDPESQFVILQQTDASGEVGGIYMDGSVQAGPRIKVRGGMRADVFSRDIGSVRLGPRLALTFMLSDRAALTFAGGQYHQYVRASEVAVLDVDPLASDSAGSIAPLSVARASHLLIALDQDVGEGVRVGLQGFYKTYEGLPDPQASPDERSHSSGLDLWVRRSTGRLTGWVGYSLGWVWSVDPSETSTDQFSGRQIVSAGITGPIGGRGKFDVRLGYGAGLPYTAIPENSVSKPAFAGTTGGPLASNVPLPVKEDTPPITTTPEDPYLRLDAQVAHTFATQWWSFAFEVTPYVRVLNALDRRDALFYQFDRTRDTQPHPLASLPVLPIIGFEWRF